MLTGHLATVNGSDVLCKQLKTHTLLQNNVYSSNQGLIEQREGKSVKVDQDEQQIQTEQEDEKIEVPERKPLAENKTDALTVSIVTGIITPPNN